MATVGTLKRRGELVELGAGLLDGEQPTRRLYGLPHVVKWLDITLPALEPFYPETDLSPIEQVDDLFHDFLSGADMGYYQRCHFMTPSTSGVWELKTIDVRMFGWFAARGIFIVANIDAMVRVKAVGLYRGYRNDVI